MSHKVILPMVIAGVAIVTIIAQLYGLRALMVFIFICTIALLILEWFTGSNEDAE